MNTIDAIAHDRQKAIDLALRFTNQDTTPLYPDDWKYERALIEISRLMSPYDAACMLDISRQQKPASFAELLLTEAARHNYAESYRELVRSGSECPVHPALGWPDGA